MGVQSHIERKKLDCDDMPLNRLGGSILIIEDDEALRKSHAMLVKHVGHEARVAVSGESGLEMFKEYDDILMVLLDIGLPDIRGTEVCKRMREIDKGRHVPIIFVTAHCSEEEIAEANADGYVSKPLLKEGLKELCKKWLW